MNEELKILSQKTAEAVTRKIKKATKEEFYKFSINTDLGADGTITKYVDKIAEDAALNYLQKSKIKVNVLSEEAGYIDNNADYTFVLDPIDGTRNAYRGIPFFAISIAVGKSKMSHTARK